MAFSTVARTLGTIAVVWMGAFIAFNSLAADGYAIKSSEYAFAEVCHRRHGEDKCHGSVDRHGSARAGQAERTDRKFSFAVRWD